MEDKDKTKEQLIKELAQMRQQIAEREAYMAKNSEKWLKALANNLTIGIYIVQDGKFRFANSIFRKYVGYSEEELYGMNSLSIVFPEDRDMVRENAVKMLKRELSSPYEFRCISKSGDILYCLETVTSVQYQGRRAAMGSFVDITERKQLEEKYRQLIEDMSDGYVVIQDGKCVFANERFCDIFGYKPGQVIGKTIAQFLISDDRPTQMEKYERVERGEEAVPEQREGRRIKEDGLIVTIEASYKAIQYDGKPAFSVIVRDITERKKVEEILRMHSELLDMERDSVYVYDFERNFIYVNKAVCTAHGYTKEELLNMKLSELDDPKSAKLIALRIKEIMKKGQATFEVHHRYKDGSLIPLEIHTSIIELQGKKLIMSVARDITERKMAEEALRASEASLREAQRIAHLGNWDLDIINNRLRWSEELFRIFGMDPQTYTPSFESCLSFIHPGDRKRVKKAYKEGLQGSKAYSIEYRILRRDGSGVTVHDKSEVITDEAGRSVRMFGTIYDLTERKKMEEKFVLTDRLASIGEMASGVAHEMNNPLTSVLGFSELLLSQDAPEAIKENLRIINREAQRTVQIVKNLLRFARKYTPRKEPVNVNSILEMVLEIRAYEQKTHNIEVVRRFSHDLPEIMADGFQLQQVFLNIVINAEYFMIEAHNRGTFIITTEAAGDMVRVSFADDGPGIPSENLGHIFDPFFTTKKVGKGTGLGLSICYGIVTEHGGRIYAESEPGKGANFIVELPI